MPLSVSHSRSWAVWPTHSSQNCFCCGLRAEQARQLFKGVFAAEDNRKHPSFHSTHVFTTPTYISNWSKKKATNSTKSWGNVSTFVLHLHCLEFQWRKEVHIIKSTRYLVRGGKESNSTCFHPHGVKEGRSFLHGKQSIFWVFVFMDMLIRFIWQWTEQEAVWLWWHQKYRAPYLEIKASLPAATAS